jgi:hypothetical protein
MRGVKSILIVVAGVAGLVVAVVVLGIFTHVFDRHERVGHFDIYTNPKVPDSSVQSALYYKWHLLTDRLNGYDLDPNNLDRILFSSDDVFHGTEGLCGTYLYDGRSKQLTRLRRWPYAGRLWSPDSRFILLDRATVHELLTGEEVDLTDSVSREDGGRVELSILQWSPDSQRLAGVIRISPDGRELDLDLVEIARAPLSVRYVATVSHSPLVWTEKEIGWSSGELQVAAPSTPERQIIVKPPDALSWTNVRPSAVRTPKAYESPCSSVESMRP